MIAIPTVTIPSVQRFLNQTFSIPQVFREPITSSLGVSLPTFRSQEPVHRHLLQHLLFVGFTHHQETQQNSQSNVCRSTDSLESTTYISTET